MKNVQILYDPIVDNDLKHIDLHLHSNYSIDSNTSYEEVIAIVKAFDISTISFTDHETLGDIERLRYIAGREDISIVNGVEISTRVGKKSKRCHIIGYNFDPHSDPIRNLLDRIKKLHISIVNYITENLLYTHGWKMPEIDIEELVNGSPVISILWNIAKMIYYNPENLETLIKTREIHVVDDVFSTILELYSDVESLTDFDSEEVLWSINSSGGIPVIAHPIKSKLTKAEIGILVDMGLKGIETFHPKNTEKMVMFLLRMARQMKLGITKGSDFHGTDKTDTEVKKIMTKKEINTTKKIYMRMMDKLSRAYYNPTAELRGISLANIRTYMRLHNCLNNQINYSREKTKVWKNNQKYVRQNHKMNR